MSKIEIGIQCPQCKDKFKVRTLKPKPFQPSRNMATCPSWDYNFPVRFHKLKGEPGKAGIEYMEGENEPTI